MESRKRGKERPGGVKYESYVVSLGMFSRCLWYIATGQLRFFYLG